jgi:hypothetical protein
MNIRYHLYQNVADKTYVIVSDKTLDQFINGLTELGYPPKLIESSAFIEELQLKAIELEMQDTII